MFNWLQPFIDFITTDIAWGFGFHFSFLDFWVVTCIMALLYKLMKIFLLGE